MRSRLLSHAVRVTFHRQLTRGFSVNKAVVMAPIKAGDTMPSVDLFEGNPGNKLNTADLFKSGKHVIVGVPGAFTPTCHKDHMPTFVADFQSIKDKDVDSINCVAVNDPFVMAAWGEALDSSGKIRFLADTCGEFTKAIDLSLDVTNLLGNVRCQRFAMVVQDGKVTGVNVEEDSGKATCSKSTGVMDLL